MAVHAMQRMLHLYSWFSRPDKPELPGGEGASRSYVATYCSESLNSKCRVRRKKLRDKALESQENQKTILSHNNRQFAFWFMSLHLTLIYHEPHLLNLLPYLLYGECLHNHVPRSGPPHNEFNCTSNCACHVDLCTHHRELHFLTLAYVC